MQFFFLDQVLSYLSGNIGIDLGTANTPVYVKGKGMQLNEPSYVAIDNVSGKVVAVGARAKEMHGRAPGHISVIRPLRDGVIANFEIAYQMLKYFLGKVSSLKNSIPPRVIVGVPSDVTPVERRAVSEATVCAGARKAYLVEQPLAAAIGADLPVVEPVGSMIVDIGAGTTEIAVIALGGIVVSHSLRVAGDEMDEAIVYYLRKMRNLLVGERTAERIKIAIAGIDPEARVLEMQVRGRDLLTGLPRSILTNTGEIRESLLEIARSIVDGVKMTLEETPPELLSDILARGIVLAGGGGLLRGLPEVIGRATGVPVRLAPDPLFAVLNGAGKLLDSPSLLRQTVLRENHRW
ncbi:MAG: rod shape-determining protein [Armatimonadetes bacterium]|nr:rod shape-determining protein [Armatimonadota bacterium]